MRLPSWHKHIDQLQGGHALASIKKQALVWGSPVSTSTSINRKTGMLFPQLKNRYLCEAPQLAQAHRSIARWACFGLKLKTGTCVRLPSWHKHTINHVQEVLQVACGGLSGFWPAQVQWAGSKYRQPVSAAGTLGGLLIMCRCKNNQQHVWAHTLLHTPANTHTHANVCTSAHTYPDYSRAHAHTHKITHIHTHEHTHTHTHILSYTHKIHTQNTYTPAWQQALDRHCCPLPRVLWQRAHNIHVEAWQAGSQESSLGVGFREDTHPGGPVQQLCAQIVRCRCVKSDECKCFECFKCFKCFECFNSLYASVLSVSSQMYASVSSVLSVMQVFRVFQVFQVFWMFQFAVCKCIECFKCFKCFECFNSLYASVSSVSSVSNVSSRCMQVSKGFQVRCCKCSKAGIGKQRFMQGLESNDWCRDWEAMTNSNRRPSATDLCTNCVVCFSSAECRCVCKDLKALRHIQKKQYCTLCVTALHFICLMWVFWNNCRGVRRDWGAHTT